MRPILCRPGGKKLLAKTILKEIPKHDVYVEPFMGSGTIFFGKDLAKKSVLGDNDKRLMDFYRDVKKMDGLTCDLRRDKNKFDRLKNKKDKSPCDYAYVTKMSFGGTGKSYNTAHSPNSFQKYDEQIAKLKKAQLVSSDFKKTIKETDSKDTFFYLDPPYYEKSCSYPKGSCDVTPKDVADTVKGIKGKFILSYNDHPEVKKEFCQKYHCKRVDTKYTANKLNNTLRTKEVIIKNF